MIGTDRPRVTATPRQTGSKAMIKAVRRKGDVPGSLYGRDVEPVSVQVSARVLGAYLGAHGSGALMDLDLGGQVIPVVLKEVDRDGMTGAVSHVSFQRIVLSEELQAAIPLRFEGIDELIKNGLVLQTQLDVVELHGRADRLPEVLTVDVSHCAAGAAIHLGEIPLPEGVELSRDATIVAAIVTSPRTGGEAATEAALPEA